MTQPEYPSGQTAYAEPSKATTVLVLGIIGIVLCGILGPFAWVMGNSELRAINDGRRPPENRGTANAGKILGIISTVFLALGFVLIALFLVGALSIGAFSTGALSSLGFADDVDRDDTGDIVGGGDLDVMALQVGDCFDDSEELEEVLFDVAAVPCSEPHDNEVFSVQTVSAEVDTDDFPGQTVLQEHAYEVCSGPVFDTYVGTPYLDSILEVFTITPTSESWDEGDREFVCALYRLDFAKLTGSARDSGL